MACNPCKVGVSIPGSAKPSREPLRADCVPTFIKALFVNEVPLWHEAQFCAVKTASPATAAAVKVPFAFRSGLRGVCEGVKDDT